MSILHMAKFGLKLQTILKCRRPERGVVSDYGHPRTRGGGGVKKGQIFADVLSRWPLLNTQFFMSLLCNVHIIQGVPKVIVQRFGLIARPVII